MVGEEERLLFFVVARLDPMVRACVVAGTRCGYYMMRRSCMCDWRHRRPRQEVRV